MKTKPSIQLNKKSYWGNNINSDAPQDKNIDEDETFNGECPVIPSIPLPNTDNEIFLILNTLNQNVADFYTFMKFTSYLSDAYLNIELLKRSMSIHRDFAVLFLHTKEDLVFTYPEFLEKTEKLLFKGEAGTNCINYTNKLCKALRDYKIALHREGYLPNLRKQSLLVNLWSLANYFF